MPAATRPGETCTCREGALWRPCGGAARPSLSDRRLRTPPRGRGATPARALTAKPLPARHTHARLHGRGRGAAVSNRRVNTARRDEYNDYNDYMPLSVNYAMFPKNVLDSFRLPYSASLCMSSTIINEPPQENPPKIKAKPYETSRISSVTQKTRTKFGNDPR